MDTGQKNDASSGPNENRPAAGTKPPKRKHHWRRAGIGLLVFIGVLAIARAAMPSMVRNYVNRTLDRNQQYSGRIGDVHIHLWRGAYSIDDITVSKKTGDVPVPLFKAKTLDLAVQWNALFHGKIVGRVAVEEPEVNFVDAPSEEASQSGGGGPWLQMIQDLFPFSINSAVINNGSVHFRTYKSETPVDVYLSKFHMEVNNLRNVVDTSLPLNASVTAKALAMDSADLDMKMTLDPFSYRPTFHMAMRLLGLDVTKVNDLALTYGKFDFKHGFFDLVLEVDSKEGQMTGYVKPLFRDLRVFQLRQDIKEDNPLQFFWQAIVGATTKVLRNQPRDQFGALIPFTADASGSTSVQILSTIGSIFRNAFIRAYLPNLEGRSAETNGIHFGAPDFNTALSSTDGT